MRNFIMIMISMILGLLTLGMTFSISGRANRSAELHSNLSSADEQTLQLLLEGDGRIISREELLAYFVQQLVIEEDAESDLKVEIAYLDIQKGLLSTRVGQIFEYPNGKEGSVYYDRTTILEQVP